MGKVREFDRDVIWNVVGSCWGIVYEVFLGQ